jgi:hypothetical protein
MADYVTDSGRVDGSWELTIEVTDVQVEKKLRVNGDLHIGGVMVKLVEALGVYHNLISILIQVFAWLLYNLVSKLIPEIVRIE